MTDITSPAASNVVSIQNTSAPLREQVAAARDREGLSLRVLLGELGLNIPSANLGRWLDGHRIEGQPELEDAARAWLARIGQPTPQAERDKFVETSTSERILSALGYAQHNGDLISIYGGPGVGKTRTIWHYRAQFEHVWIATITPACSTVVPMLEEMAEAVGLHEVAGGARRMSRAIQAKVRGLRGLIIIDEAQHLSMTAIEQLRSIHDATGIGIALVGNELSHTRLTGGRAANFAQINSRIGLKLYLRRPEERDVRQLCSAYGLKDRDSIALLERIASRPGALRAVVKVLRLASAAGTMTPERIRKAVDNLGAEV